MTEKNYKQRRAVDDMRRPWPGLIRASTGGDQPGLRTQSSERG